MEFLRRTPVFSSLDDPATCRPIYFVGRRKAETLVRSGEAIEIVVGDLVVLKLVPTDSKSRNSPTGITARESAINAGVQAGNRTLVLAKLAAWKEAAHAVVGEASCITLSFRELRKEKLDENADVR